MLFSAEHWEEKDMPQNKFGWHNFLQHQNWLFSFLYIFYPADTVNFLEDP